MTLTPGRPGAQSRKALALVLIIAHVTAGHASRWETRDAPRVRMPSLGISTTALTSHSLAFNSLTYNSLSNNALTTHALASHSVTQGSLSLDSLVANSSDTQADPAAGDLTSDLLRYLVSCAFTENQSLTIPYEGSDVQYKGSVGLAPEWQDGRLSPSGALWVSACLAARTNWYGAHVDVSMRGAHPELITSRAERQQYSRMEGAFWGDYFSGEAVPRFYACYDKANVENSRKHQRDCAAGHRYSDGSVLGCGPDIAIVGRCDEVCSTKVGGDGGYYTSCSVADQRTTEVLTVYLP